MQVCPGLGAAVRRRPRRGERPGRVPQLRLDRPGRSRPTTRATGPADSTDNPGTRPESVPTTRLPARPDSRHPPGGSMLRPARFAWPSASSRPYVRPCAGRDRPAQRDRPPTRAACYPTGLRGYGDGELGCPPLRHSTTPTRRRATARVVAYFPTDQDGPLRARHHRPGHSRMRLAAGGAGPVTSAATPGTSSSSSSNGPGARSADRCRRSDEKVRSRGMIYRARSESTCVIVDRCEDDGDVPTPDGQKALVAATVFRANRGLSPSVNAVSETLLPPMDEAYDGVDQVILAGNQLLTTRPVATPCGSGSGTGAYLWVMLDLVDPRLGRRSPRRRRRHSLRGPGRPDDRADRSGTGRRRKSAPTPDFDQPVDLVRVELADRDRVLHTVNGWPASFLRPFGRGRILFTTLGVEAWHRPRTARDGRSPVRHLPRPAGRPGRVRRVRVRTQKVPGSSQVHPGRPPADADGGDRVRDRQSRDRGTPTWVGSWWRSFSSRSACAGRGGGTRSVWRPRRCHPWGRCIRRDRRARPPGGARRPRGRSRLSKP